ncbi:ABC transporter substrate-binding protein [Elioraea sp.]|uniref:ABC transporter substrate-binding protein n=1 Tax=Elioraea sp. TaxID=2185103 RepID=UPI003F714F9C
MLRLTRRHLGAATLVAPFFVPQRASAQASGNLRIALGTSLRTLDPAKTTLGEEYIYDNLVFNGLTRMREDLAIEPDLAESWTFSEDLKTWTFRLRRGVKFHNGREMTATDVIATYRRILDPETAAAPRSNYMMIEDMQAPDPYTVVFRLSYPYGGFADILSDRQVKIIPHDHLDTLATAPIGTGPFTMRSYTPGDRMVLTRFPDYFESGMPRFETVELRIVPEMAVRIAALQAGDMDVVWDIPPEQVKPLSENRALKVESVATGSWDAAIMNNAIAPFNDPRVRRAFHMAVDKRDVVELVLFGEGAPTHSPIPPNHPFFAADIPVTRADPAGARRLLREAGHPNGVRVPIVVPVGRPVRERLGVTLQQLARTGGFELDVQRVPFSRYNAEVSGKAPFYVDGYFARPTIDTGTHPFLHSQGTWNARLWHYKNETVDRALDAARLTGDPEKQKVNYLEMQRALAADPAGYIAYSVNFACAYRASVQDVATHPMRWFDLRKGWNAA